MFITPSNYIRTPEDDAAEAARLAMVSKRHERAKRAVSERQCGAYRARLRDLH